MGRRRQVRARPQVTTQNNPNSLQSRIELLTYAFSRLPPRQLPILALYAYCIIYACNHNWISREATGKAGTAVVGVLSMVTGLLLSYRFSSAVSKWDEGKKVWVGVRTAVRDGVRMTSLPWTAATLTPSLNGSSSSTEDLGGIALDDQAKKTTVSRRDKETPPASSPSRKGSYEDLASERVDELAGLLVGYAFALQHHLLRTRPLPQPPLCDLLPQSYLASLKRTEARVRFAETHFGRSTAGSPAGKPKQGDTNRPGFRRRGTGPPSDDEKAGVDNDWHLDAIKLKAEEALSNISSTSLDLDDPELRQQLSQLNVPAQETTIAGTKPKSNLTAPHPNLPLALLRLMESYVVGLANLAPERGGWSEAKRERCLAIIKDLSRHLGDAERLANNPPPLPLTLHLSHLVIIYLAALPCSLLCLVRGPYLILISLVAGWCLLGLEALITEVGGVFGESENHHPLPLFANQILNESLDLSPSFMKYYRARLVGRVGEEEAEVVQLDQRCRRSGEGWMPVFQ